MLRVGALGFGGPLVTISLMREELVAGKSLVTPRRFQEGLSLVKMLPGPVSSLMAIFLGQELAGWRGGSLALAAFVLPSFLMILGLAAFEGWIEAHGGAQMLHAVTATLQVAVVVVIAATCVRLFEDARESGREDGLPAWRPFAFALAAALMAFGHVSEPLILLVVGLAGLALDTPRFRPPRALRVHPISLFWVFFVSGLTVFGTGYMVLPALERTLVQERAWLDAASFLKSVVYGNLTPGPIVIASTYMGYRIDGIVGATAATVGIFAGPALLMLGTGRYLRRLLGLAWTRSFLQGIVPAVAATIFVSLYSMVLKIEWGYVEIALAAFCVWACWRRVAVWRGFLVGGVIGAIQRIAG